MPRIRLQGITKHFGPVQAVQDLSIDVPSGTHHLLVGPSGSGKSTTLRLIAGLDFPNAGRILLDDTDVTRLPPEERPCGWVAQSPGLLPHLTLVEQLELPLRLQAVDRHQRRARAEVMADRLDLRRRLHHLPASLSGGEAARTALGRALILRPRLVLLDEPFAHLDPTLRRDLRRLLRDLQRDFNLTLLHVTHHPADLIAEADHLTVIEGGRVLQSGCPLELYRQPRTPWLADLTGDSPIWRCTSSDWSRNLVHLPPEESPCPEPSILGLRPEQLALSSERPTGPCIGPVRIGRITPVGPRTWVEVHWGDAQRLDIPVPPHAGCASQGDTAWIQWNSQDALWFEVRGC